MTFLIVDLYFCYGSQKPNIFGFVMAAKKLNFFLAKKAGSNFCQKYKIKNAAFFFGFSIVV